MSDAAGKPRDAACARWDIPQIDDVVGAGPDTHAGDAHQRGYDEGFAQGHAEALAAGQAQVQAQLAYLQDLMTTLSEPFARLDEAVETALLSLAMQTAERVLRHELSVRPEQVLAIIRAALQALPVASRQVVLRLHPEDAALVGEHMPTATEDQGWRIEEDPGVSRGGCIVTSEHSRIDATLEQQLARIADNVLGAAGEAGEPS